MTTPALGVAPGPATGLLVSNVSITSLTLSWTSPSSGSAPFTYQPQQSANGGATWTNIGLPGALTAVVVTGLQANTNYMLRVVTTNDTGSSTSAPLNALTLSVQPSAPTGLAVVGTPTASTISLQWNAPASGTPPLTYQVLSRTPSGSGAYAPLGGPTSSLTITLSGLTTASSYDFEVSASNSAGTGPVSGALINVQTSGSVGSLPGPATGLAASAITSTSLTLSWVAPVSGTTPFSYQPQRAAPGGSPVWSNIGSPVSATSVAVTGLSANTAYQFQVVTTNTAGSSTSASILATTASVLPGAPTGLQTTGVPTATTVPLAWTAPVAGSPPLSYQVLLRTPTGSGAFTSAGPLTSSVSQTISGLAASTGYDFEVTASNLAGTGPASTILLNVTTAAASGSAPGPATGLTVSALLATSLTLSWTAPATGTPPFTYQPQQSTNGGATWANIGSGISAVTVNVTGLAPNTAFQFQVITTNSAGSSTSTAVSATTPAVLPTAPTGLAVSGSPTQTSITLQWFAPATGTAPFTYQVLLRTPSGSGPFNIASSSTTALSQAISGLSPGTGYDFEVYATNSAGNGPASTILLNALTASATGVLPSAPTNLTAATIASTSVVLTWSPPATGSTPFQYVVQYQAT